MSIDNTLAKLDALIAEVERHYTCDCGKHYELRPNISGVARVECGCGVRRDFNLR
jgi:hypothetical protein